MYIIKLVFCENLWKCLLRLIEKYILPDRYYLEFNTSYFQYSLSTGSIWAILTVFDMWLIFVMPFDMFQ